jgi:glycosyltransferase 2 family protein
MTSRIRVQPWLISTARFAFSILLLASLFYFLPMAQLWAALSKLPPGVWLAVLFAYLFGHMVGMLKWRLMVNLAGTGLSYRQSARCYFGGLFGTLFLPSIVGGDVVRMGLAMRNSRSRTGTALACLLDRVIDFVALACLAGIGVALVPGSLNATSQRVFWSIAAAVSLAAAALIACLLLMPVRKFPRKVQRIMAQTRQSWRVMVAQRRYVALALALGIGIQAWFVFLTAKVAGMCGLHVPIHGWLVAWPLAKLSALVPLTQGGIGVREVALAALLAPFGAKPVLTVAVGLVWEAIIVVTSLFGGLVSFVAARLSPAEQSGEETRATAAGISPASVPLPDSQE